MNAARTGRTRSATLVAELEAWLRRDRAKLSAKAPVAQAIGLYMLKRWSAFILFSYDGRPASQQRSPNGRSAIGLAAATGPRWIGWPAAIARRPIHADRDAPSSTGIDAQAWLADVLSRSARPSGPAHRRSVAVETGNPTSAQADRCLTPHREKDCSFTASVRSM